MNRQIVGLSVDKVQTFLAETVNSHVQEKQTEGKTLSNIKSSSKEISVRFFDDINDKFAIEEDEYLLRCSGVVIFYTSLPEVEIEERLNQLFCQYYCDSKGQKLLKYVMFPVDNRTEIEALQEAKKRLKQSTYSSQIIQKNRALLFDFQVSQENTQATNNSTNRYDNEQNNNEKESEAYTMFADSINALYCGDTEQKQPEDMDDILTKKKNRDNSNRFRIAVIKADLDGMGDMFKHIQEYKTYQEVSKRLYEDISLEGLHKIANKCKPENKDKWLFPFYIAGDDIFFAVEISDMLAGIQVCQELLKRLKERLKPYLKEYKNLRLSISIGVEITYNRQPIRYYLEMVDRQLKVAKQNNLPEGIIASDKLNELLNGKIAIGGHTFFDVDYKEVKNLEQSMKQKVNKDMKLFPVWCYFLNDVKTLQYIKSDGSMNKQLGTSGFFYSLLEKLTDSEAIKNDRSYINHLLYSLAPEYMERTDSLWKYEMILKANILKQLGLTVEGNKDNLSTQVGYGNNILLNKNQKKRLEAYLRLMLLFSDSRFDVMKCHGIQDDKLIGDNRIDEAEKTLLSKALNYSYHNLLKGSLRDYFVRPDKNKKNNNEKSYRTMKIGTSMLHKFREVDKTTLDKVIQLLSIENVNKDDKIQDKNEFEQMLSLENEWTADYVESLMVFYKYNEAYINYKKKPKEVNSRNNNNRNNNNRNNNNNNNNKNDKNKSNYNSNKNKNITKPGR
jgi:hypothetical protein